jgi:MinD-like ATPase involved in chromosome partitioning or flagellar assembly
VSLAAALGAVAPTVLVDADLSGPSVAVHLNLDWTRNLYMLAHAAPATRREWERAIEQETQPLGPRSPHGVALCGVPKPAMRAAVTAGFLERLVTELRRPYRYVVLDVGADLLGAEAAAHRAAVALGQHVLLTAAADLAGLWHARTALGLLHTLVPVGPERMALVVTRHDRRHHQGRAEIEWALRVPAAAVVPYDHGAAQRALAAQRPLVHDGRSRAGRALLDLAERIHAGGPIRMPEAEGHPRRPRWRWSPWPPARTGAPGRVGAPTLPVGRPRWAIWLGWGDRPRAAAGTPARPAQSERKGGGYGNDVAAAG